MELSLCHAHPTGEVSYLNCVYLLAPCRANLPINCMLIFSVNYLVIFCFKPPPQPLDNELHHSTHHPFFLPFSSSPRCPSFKPPRPKYIHINTYPAWVWWHVVVVVDGTKKAPVMKILPAVLGSHLLFHTRQNLWAQHSASLRSCWDVESF